MSTGEIASSLAALPHFRSLEPAILERIAATCVLSTYRSRAPIFRQDDPCRGFFVIRAGRVRLFRSMPDGREHVVHSLREGQSFAEAALFNFGSYPVSAEAVANPTEIIEVQGRPFLELFYSERRIAAAMVGSLCVRLLSLVQRVDELSATSAAARLARHLLHMPSRGTPITVELSTSKRELARLLSITPETLSRLLRSWREGGMLRTEGRKLVLLDVAQIATIADGG
ncbi:MAG: Crp/Fnr family transcriptional regulator [Planctomycetota bacterium]